MKVGYDFHPEAVLEFGEATRYYLREGSPKVAEAFVSAVESAIDELCEAPDRWRVVVEASEIRRYVLKRFPFVIYYRWQSGMNRVVIVAVMHTSRKPEYWKSRAVE